MSDTRTVWRYQNTDNWGPYTAAWPGRTALQYAHTYHGPARHGQRREWGKDGLTAYALSTAVACCPSLPALLYWFDGWHERLAEAGFRLAVYTLPEVNVAGGDSGLQCVARLCGAQPTFYARVASPGPFPLPA